MHGFFALCPNRAHTDRGVRLLSVGLLFVAVLISSPTRAWSGEPLCAFEPETLVSLPEPAEHGIDTPMPIRMCVVPEPTSARDLTAPSVRDAWQRAQTLDSAERALLELQRVDEAMPRLRDLIQVQRGELLLQLERWADARQAFADAIDLTVDTEILLRARVGRVRALLAMGHRDATNELTMLRRHYPDLPEQPELEFALAQLRESEGKTREAIVTYRRIDVRHPGTAVGRRSRARLEAMRTEGVDVRPMPPTQRVERAERLVSRGPLSDARTAIAELLEESTLGATLRARVLFMAAKIARHEGRWADARRLLSQGHATGAAVGDEEDQERRTDRAEDMARAAQARERDEAERRIRQLRAGRTLQRHGTARIFGILRVAARAGLVEDVNECMAELVRRHIVPGLRLQAVLDSAGIVDDEHVVALLDESLTSRPGTMGLQATYHRARALQRLGRLAEAEIAFLQVIERDHGITPFYAMWSELQLADVRGAMLGLCGPDAQCRTAAEIPRDDGEAQDEETLQTDPEQLASKPEDTVPASASTREREFSEVLEGVRRLPGSAPEPREWDLDAAATRLEPLVQAHGQAFPWMGRAQDFLRLGERQEAGRQLYEAFLAWREANGRPIRRAGLESVARGAERPRRGVDWATRRARKRVTAEQRTEIAEIGELIGDIGVSTGWGGWDRVAERPRAYAESVERAARRHGLDPNLLFAVMRVESVYQKEIVSYAGAIGLCQIMPRTGQLIADAVGKQDYTSADLLDPDTNLDFAAWYLRSLIERFDGRLPLAIASYNGGPHNVRRWMQDLPADMPLDTFLEHIPFDQTHRYVRRVLTHYRAYRAQEGLPMIALSTALPEQQVDLVAF